MQLLIAMSKIERISPDAVLCCVTDRSDSIFIEVKFALFLFAGSHICSWSVQLPHSYKPPLLRYHPLHQYLTTSKFPSTSIINPPQPHHTITQHRKHLPLIQGQGASSPPIRSLPSQPRPIKTIQYASQQTTTRPRRLTPPCHINHHRCGSAAASFLIQKCFFQQMLAFRGTPERATCASKTSWVESVADVLRVFRPILMDGSESEICRCATKV
ncbi:hypothetical protein DL98DRAFT_71424 [Cadophora sp. DSE1049]|nr:hypothetical protein DL98DRAFT_71424 [Cadophora sp. DSE1049]